MSITNPQLIILLASAVLAWLLFFRYLRSVRTTYSPAASSTRELSKGHLLVLAVAGFTAIWIIPIASVFLTITAYSRVEPALRDVAVVSSENVDLHQRLAVEKENVGSLQSFKDAFENDLAQANHDRDESLSAIAKAHETIEALQNDNRKMGDNILALNSKEDKLGIMIANLEAKIRSLNSEDRVGTGSITGTLNSSANEQSPRGLLFIRAVSAEVSSGQYFVTLPAGEWSCYAAMLSEQDPHLTQLVFFGRANIESGKTTENVQLPTRLVSDVPLAKRAMLLIRPAANKAGADPAILQSNPQEK